MTDSIPLSDLERSPSAKFEQHGDKVAGTITAVKQQQQTDPVTQQPKFMPSGDPIMLLVITIETADGTSLSVWAKGGNYPVATGTGTSMQNAIFAAVRAAGGNSIDAGAQLAVAYTGDGEAKPGMNAPKLYTAQYQLPAPKPQSVPVDDLFSS